MRTLIVTFFLLTLLISCSLDRKNDNIVLLDNFSSPKEMAPALSELLSDLYNVTCLETKSECLIGKIDKVIKFKNIYYILADGQSIICFDKDGLYLGSLNKTGQGPDEYHRIEDFDVYEVDGQIEIWVSDNLSLKIYNLNDFSFKYKIVFDYVIHKFKRLQNSHILLVAGQNDHSLVLIDKKGSIIDKYLKKEIPFLMFRPVQFVKYASGYIYQLGISNSFVFFDQDTETFQKGIYSEEKSFLTEKKLLDLFKSYGMEFIKEANRGCYISNVVSYDNSFWINTYRGGQNYLTKVSNDKNISTVFSINSLINNDLFEFDSSAFLSTITMGQSDDSILLYIDSYALSDTSKKIKDKNGNIINVNAEDNPCIVEFFF